MSVMSEKRAVDVFPSKQLSFLPVSKFLSLFRAKKHKSAAPKAAERYESLECTLDYCTVC